MTKARLAEIRAEAHPYAGKRRCADMVIELCDAYERLKGRREAPKFTLEQVQGEAAAIGLNSGEPELFFHHFNARGWRYKDGGPMKSLRSALWTWKHRSDARKAAPEKKSISGNYGVS